MKHIIFWVAIIAVPFLIFFSDNSLVEMLRKQKPITEEQKSELLQKFDVESQKTLASPPHCWGYKGPRRASTSIEEMQKKTKLWLDSIGKTPPLTCEEYENN
ncbi:MAG: hypothetical protein HY242_09875 [Afipia sp.]|nr:hypothetical protein [Afipia sp.]